jgi:hypothetical protein
LKNKTNSQNSTEAQPTRNNTEEYHAHSESKEEETDEIKSPNFDSILCQSPNDCVAQQYQLKNTCCMEFSIAADYVHQANLTKAQGVKQQQLR